MVFRRYNILVRFWSLISIILLATALALAQNSSGNNPSNSDPANKDSAGKTAAPAQPGSAPSSDNSQKSSAPPPTDQSPATNPKNDQTPSFDPPSSMDTRVDLTPPSDDAKSHPSSSNAVSDLVSDDNNTGIQEFHPWNPMKAQKDVQIGDFYFRRKNYKAALDRYKEALYYQNNYAIAVYRLAVCEEKLGDKAEAAKNYQQYLNILPEGPQAKEARVSLERLAQAFK